MPWVEQPDMSRMLVIGLHIKHLQHLHHIIWVVSILACPVVWMFIFSLSISRTDSHLTSDFTAALTGMKLGFRSLGSRRCWRLQLSISKSIDYVYGSNERL
jgi:hypothetical protein